MLDVTITTKNGGGTKYRAAAVDPFGAACVVLTGAWLQDWNGSRHETEADARSIILPAPAAGEMIEFREVKG